MNNKDLNLLKIFDILWQYRSVSRAAGAAALSQPAMSHALGRLRELYQDELFVRIPGGVAPTPKAETLAPAIQKILASIEHTFATKTFDPATAAATVTIGGTDYLDQILFARLVPVLLKKAPGIRLISRSTEARLPKKELESGELDLAIAGFFDDMPEGFYQQQLFKDSFSCLVRQDHPDIHDRVTLKQFTAMKHILISPSGELEGVVDDVLKKMGLTRNVVASFPTFQAPGWILANADVILTAPTRLAHSFMQYLPVKMIPAPITLPGFTVLQVWHKKMHRHPVHQFIRQEIFSIARDLNS